MITDKKTVLMDLDGTLLPIDIEKFTKRYLKLLVEEFSDISAPNKLKNVLWQATGAMVENDGKKTNREVFMDHFFSAIKVGDKEKIMDRFHEFYRDKYPSLQQGIPRAENAVKIVKILQDKGYQLVIATNPLFPQIAVEERIKWAGLDPEDFSYISTFEDMHYAKPSPSYYEEILEKIEESPSNCIMIGNDAQEDLIAEKVGITTFLVEDYMIDRGNSDLTPSWRGSMEELKSYLESKFD